MNHICYDEYEVDSRYLEAGVTVQFGGVVFLDAVDLVFDLFVGCWPSLLQFGSLCPLFAVLSEPLMECDIYHLPWWFAFVSLTLSVLRVSGHVYAASACWAVFHNTRKVTASYVFFSLAS